MKVANLLSAASLLVFSVFSVIILVRKWGVLYWREKVLFGLVVLAFVNASLSLAGVNIWFSPLPIAIGLLISMTIFSRHKIVTTREWEQITCQMEFEISQKDLALRELSEAYSKLDLAKAELERIRKQRIETAQAQKERIEKFEENAPRDVVREFLSEIRNEWAELAK